MKNRRRFTAEFKAKVALEALQETCTVNELGSSHGIHPTQIGKWKREVKENAARLFDHGHELDDAAFEERAAKLYEEIGRLKMELTWLRKKNGIVR